MNVQLFWHNNIINRINLSAHLKAWLDVKCFIVLCLFLEVSASAVSQHIIQIFLLICLICYSKKDLHMISIMLLANVLPNVQIRQIMNLSEPNSKS